MDDLAAYYPPPPPGIQSYYPSLPPAATVPAPPPVPVATHDLYYPAHYTPQHPTFASYSQSISPALPSHDSVRTLFVAGLPEDVKPREIYNLFREFPGYESSNLRTPNHNSQPFAFAVFSDPQSALAAMHAINGMVFDLEKGSTLYIDFAKSNSRTKRLRTGEDDKSGSNKKFQGSSLSRGSFDSGIGSFHISGMGNSAHNTIGYPSAQRGNLGITAVKPSKNAAPHAPQNNCPCPTLFVANLGPSCNEQELIQVFSRCHGFIKLKMQGTYGAPVAFVDFQDTACSTEALNQLQGAILHSSPAEGMRLEFAKSRMGMRKKTN